MIIRDNASNTVKAMSDGGFEDLGCFAHTLHLVIHDSIFSQRTIKDSLAICRNIVGHFKRSPLAYSQLKIIQFNPYQVHWYPIVSYSQPSLLVSLAFYSFLISL